MSTGYPLEGVGTSVHQQWYKVEEVKEVPFSSLYCNVEMIFAVGS